MVAIEIIQKHINEYLETKDGMFLVSIKNTPDNRIKIFIDSFLGVKIEDCIELSRDLESKMNRDIEDFSLEVSSAGIGSPFLVMEQYKKALGKTIEIKQKDGIKITGELTELADKYIIVKTQGKKKGAESVTEIISLDDILSAKEIITF